MGTPLGNFITEAKCLGNLVWQGLKDFLYFYFIFFISFNFLTFQSKCWKLLKTEDEKQQGNGTQRLNS